MGNVNDMFPAGSNGSHGHQQGPTPGQTWNTPNAGGPTFSGQQNFTRQPRQQTNPYTISPPAQVNYYQSPQTRVHQPAQFDMPVQYNADNQVTNRYSGGCGGGEGDGLVIAVIVIAAAAALWLAWQIVKWTCIGIFLGTRWCVRRYRDRNAVQPLPRILPKTIEAAVVPRAIEAPKAIVPPALSTQVIPLAYAIRGH